MPRPTTDEIRDLFAMARDPAFAIERARRAAAFDPNRRWVSEDGYRLSDRLWQAKKWTRDQIDQCLKDAIAKGEDALITAKKLEQFLDPAYAPIRTTKGRMVRNQRRAVVTSAPYRGGSGSFPARRLARTEITRAHGAGTIATAQTTPFATGVRWSLSGRHPKADVCDANANHDEGLGRGVWPTGNVPPYPEHPQDLCTLSVALNEDVDAVVDQLRQEFGLGPVAPPTVAGPAAFPGPFADLADAEAWASQQYPHITWDFAGAHVDVMNPTLAEFHRLAQEWPEVANRLTHVGTYQGKMRGVAQGFTGTAEGQVAHAYMTQGTIIGLNPAYYGDPAKFREFLRYSRELGWLSDKESFAATMTHEFGHMVDSYLQSTKASFLPLVTPSGDGLVSQLWRNFTRDNYDRFRTADLSHYSLTHQVETVSEAFGYHVYPSDRPPTRAYVRQQAVLDFIQAKKRAGQWYDTVDDWQWTSDLPRGEAGSEARSGAFDASEALMADIEKAIKDAERRLRRQQRKANA